MGWLRTILDPSTWFMWTVAGRAARDARRNVPTENQCREMECHKGNLETVRLLIEKLRKTPTRARSAVPPSSEVSTLKYTQDDYDEIVDSLTDLLKERDIPLSSLTRDHKIGLAEVLADFVAELQVGELRAGNVHRTNKLSFYEANLISLAEMQVSRICEKWQQAKQALETKAKMIQHRLDYILQELADQHARHKQKGLRQPHRIMPKWIYLPTMVIVGSLEFPFNSAAFEILEMPPEELFLLALGPSVAIPLLAHFVGTKIRQWPEKEPAWRIILITVFAGLSLLLGLGAIGYLRAAYVGREAGSTNLAHMFALLAINLLFLSVATVAAYFAHDPDRELERIWGEKKRLRRALERAWKAWSRVAGEYDTRRGHAIEKARTAQKEAQAQVDEYRAHNARWRPGAGWPSSFAEPVSDRFFGTRDFGGELDRTPPPLDDILRRIQQREDGSGVT
jgi:hypothetical protein